MPSTDSESRGRTSVVAGFDPNNMLDPMEDREDQPPLLFASVDTSRQVEELASILDRQAEAYAAIRRAWYPKLGLRPGSSVIDCGCGPGRAAMEMAELVGPSGHVLGIDASASM